MVDGMSFKRDRFQPDVIRVAIWLYIWVPDEFAPEVGVRPWGRTGSGGGFNQGRAVDLLEARRAEIAER